jgi:hypothetical protein
MKRKPVLITDHAVVRFLERVAGLDIEALRDALADRTWPAVQAGAATLVVGGHRYCLDGRTLITVRPVKRARPRIRPEIDEDDCGWDGIGEEDQGWDEIG